MPAMMETILKMKTGLRRDDGVENEKSATSIGMSIDEKTVAVRMNPMGGPIDSAHALWVAVGSTGPEGVVVVVVETLFRGAIVNIP